VCSKEVVVVSSLLNSHASRSRYTGSLSIGGVLKIFTLALSTVLLLRPVIAQSPSGTAAVSVAPESLSFGDQLLGKTTAAQIVTVKNNQPASLTITSITTNLTDYTATTTCPLSPATLSGGTTCTISVFFTPAAEGARSATLTIADNAYKDPAVSLTGNGILPLVASPAMLSFGDQVKGLPSPTKSVTLTNNQPGPLTISSITSSSSDFVATSTCPISPKTLAPGSSCVSAVSFSPQATGIRTGTLTFLGNSISSPQVALSGTGLPPALVSIAVTPSPGSIAMGKTRQFTATGTYTDASTANLSNSVEWSQTNNAVVMVNSKGLATGLSIGNATVSATSGAVSDSTTIAVNLGPAPSSFFGLQFNSPNSQVTAPFGRCRIWGGSGTLWADLEPSKGIYKFETLDATLASARQAGISDGCIFTFGYFPQWASTHPDDDTCEKLNSMTGSCWPPDDLNFDGTGTNQTVVDALTAIATHVNNPTYLQTHAHIKYWEPFNEPYRSRTLSGTVCTTSHHCSYNGSYAQLVRIAEDMRCIIKGKGTVNGVPCGRAAIDPSASILTPSGQTYFQTNGRLVVANFLQCNHSPFLGSGCTTGARGSAATDVVNFHCYIFTGNADDAAANIAASRALLAPTDALKPFFCDEGSWGRQTDLPDRDLQAGFVARWLINILNQQVTTAMWYSWDNQTWGTLWNPKGKSGCNQVTGCLNKAGVAYEQTYNWLLGATIQGCQSAEGINTCTLSRSNGYSALIVWVPALLTSCAGQASAEVCGSTNYLVPKGYLTKRYLDGSVHPANSVEYVGAEPLLLENH
jgi:hypothetical protein